MNNPADRLAERLKFPTVAEWIAPCLLLVAPLVIFFRNQTYPVTAPESLICLAIFTAAGVVLATLGRLTGAYGRAVIFAVLATAFFDAQTGTATAFWAIPIVFLVALLVGIAFRRRLATIVSVVAGTIVISSLILPVGNASFGTFEVDAAEPADQSLPPLLHLILDEQIGVEGIPRDVNGGTRNALLLKEFFLKRGFDVYGRAYATSEMTRISIPAALSCYGGSGEESAVP